MFKLCFEMCFFLLKNVDFCEKKIQGGTPLDFFTVFSVFLAAIHF